MTYRRNHLLTSAQVRSGLPKYIGDRLILYILCITQSAPHIRRRKSWLHLIISCYADPFYPFYDFFSAF